MQEAYRLPRSKYSFCCPNGGGGEYLSQVQVQMGEGYPIPGPDGPDGGTTPFPGPGPDGGGVPIPGPDGGYPIPDWGVGYPGVSRFGPDWGTPPHLNLARVLCPMGGGYPILGCLPPHLDLAKVLPSPGLDGGSPPVQGWMAVPPPPPSKTEPGWTWLR